MLRVMTYNIRGCLGTDGKRSIERIARVIAHEHPTIVMLQEVDLGRPRSDHVDQAKSLAEFLEMHWIAGPSFWPRSGGTYGNAVLSKHPLHLVKHVMLPGMSWVEPRSAMWVRLEHRSTLFDLINTHLSFMRADRPAQLIKLLGPEWLTHEGMGERIILCGDLNCSATDRHFRKLARILKDAQLHPDKPVKPTWPTRRPFRRLDHILLSPSMHIHDARVIRGPLARVASDHFPVVTEIRV